MKLSTRLMLSMVVLVSVSTTIIGVLTYRNIEQLVLPRALTGIQARARLVALELEASVRGARADVIGFRSSDGIARIVQASQRSAGLADQTALNDLRARLAGRFVAELAAKPNYLAFRIIGIADGGREIVRVDRSGPGGEIRVVPEGELRRRDDRTYFQRAIDLPSGEVHVSPVELTPGAEANARVPSLRAAAPVHTRDGQPFGVVVINVDMRVAFDRVRAASSDGAIAYLVDEHGDYLVHPDRSSEQASASGKRQRLQDDFPALANILTMAEDEPRLVSDRKGEQFGIAPISVRLAQGPVVTLLLASPYSRVMAPAITALNSILLAGLLAIGVAVGLAMMLARSLTRPLVAMTKAVEAFGRGEPMAVPAHASGEIGTLSRAFARIAADTQEKSAALAKEIAERRQLFETSLDMILVVDRRGEIIRVSPSAFAIIGYRPEEMIGHSATGFIYTEDLERTRNEMRLSRRGQLMRNFECRYVHKAGRVVTMQWTGVWSEPAERHFFIGRDLTEKITADAQLRQSQKMDAIGQLTGGVAHDFNNILTVIIGMNEILGEGVQDRPELVAIGRLIDEAATRGAALTGQLLAFARRQPLEPILIQPNALMKETARLLRPALGEHIEVDASLQDDVWHTLADPAQLTAALINLAVNARDAMPNGGKLTLETRNVTLDQAYAHTNAEVRPGEYVLVAVSDTGSGIPAALLEKVFEPFFTTKEVGKGTGLGLSMVFGFVKQSGGHIKVYSEEGDGTSIKIYLPRAAAAAESLADDASLAPAPLGHETILVVEDDALVRDYVLAQLESLGYLTLAAGNAATALTYLASETSFDLLFTDIIMPGGMNGRELAEAVTRQRPGVKVLYTSGYTENAIIHHGRLDPGVFLLNKPYRKKDLAEKVRQVLDATTAVAA